MLSQMSTNVRTVTGIANKTASTKSDVTDVPAIHPIDCAKIIGLANPFRSQELHNRPHMSLIDATPTVIVSFD